MTFFIDGDSKMNNMEAAYKQAMKAFEIDEVPVGAVIVKNGKIIARAYNKKEKDNNPLGHAEIIAINKACKKLKSWRLLDCDLYVTLEPCPMCAGAIINSRIKRVIFGAKDSKAGACGSLIDLTSYPFNHKPLVDNGIMAEECASILSDFFIKKR